MEKVDTRPAIVKSGKITLSEYRVLHEWVTRHKGRPSRCEDCGITTAKWYDWANISGEYKKDVNDFKRLCRSCHRIFDIGLKEVCVRGHVIDDDCRLRYYPDGSIIRVCRKCSRIYTENWNARNKERINEYQRNYYKNRRSVKPTTTSKGKL